MDLTQFRNALGSFPTGVTIVTTADADGEPVGVTASSFNSVSLDPPMVLWSLAKSARSKADFCSSGHFAIHVLSATQEELSNRFAKSGKDKFAGVDWEGGVLGSPVLDQYVALFQCRLVHQYEGGDHVILVGEVVDYDQHDSAPLVFHGGRYAETRSRGDGGETGGDTVDIEHGAFTDDFLFYLLSRAHFQASRPARETMAKLQLSQTEYLTLAVLSMEAPAKSATLIAKLDHTGLAPNEEILGGMVEKQLLSSSNEGYELAPKGRDFHIHILSVVKAFENDLLARITPGEAHEAKRLLKKIIEFTGDDIPISWRDEDQDH